MLRGAPVSATPRVYVMTWAMLAAALVVTGGLLAWSALARVDAGTVVMALLFVIGSACAVVGLRAVMRKRT